MDVEILETEDKAEGQEEVLNIYDFEPHLKKDVNIARHNRFYQARIDSRYMNSGDNDFARLPNLYVLTITNFDPFGRDYMMYTVENVCRELPDMEYGDGLQFLYFYTKGKKGGSPEIQAMLHYFQESTEENVTNAVTQKVHSYVNRVKVLPEVKQEYMTFEQFLYFEKKEAAEEAAKEATEKTMREDRRSMLLDILQDLGTVPQELKAHVEKEEDPELLRQWCRLAAKAESIQEFEKQVS